VSKPPQSGKELTDREKTSQVKRDAVLARWGTEAERCPCGKERLSRAEKRGRESTHKPDCPFYKPPEKSGRMAGPIPKLSRTRAPKASTRRSAA